MHPRDQLTAKEIQVATLVWEGLTNRDIAKVIGTTEQVVKNYPRTTFDKLGVEPAGTGPVRRESWWRELGHGVGGWKRACRHLQRRRRVSPDAPVSDSHSNLDRAAASF